MTTPNYCIQNNGDCKSCSLANYGRDCSNQPISSKRNSGHNGGRPRHGFDAPIPAKYEREKVIRLEALAERLGRSKSDLMREALDDLLKKMVQYL